ncbi:MAG: ethylbenzene dehydrogenase-related protein [Syntrophobacteraceae bacterium]
MSRHVSAFRTLAVTSLCWLWLGCPGSASGAQLMVTATRVEQGPTGLDDGVWQKSRALSIPMEGREGLSGKKEEVTARAVYTDTDVFFLFSWRDPTRSITKESWVFDGNRWSHLKGDEDRLAILFEITRIDKFATRGCAVTCHSPPELPREQWVLATKDASEKGDLWHWKAARSDPYHHADDSWLTAPGTLGQYDPVKRSGRREDAGRGGDLRNETPDKLRPRYMRDPSKKTAGTGILLEEEIVEIRDDSTFKAGDTITYRIPRKPDGSRSDVEATSRYENGGWTLMLHRRLDTGHEDDVVFDPKKRYSFAMALFDDAGDDHSKATDALILEFH